MRDWTGGLPVRPDVALVAILAGCGVSPASRPITPLQTTASACEAPLEVRIRPDSATPPRPLDLPARLAEMLHRIDVDPAWAREAHLTEFGPLGADVRAGLALLLSGPLALDGHAGCGSAIVEVRHACARARVAAPAIAAALGSPDDGVRELAAALTACLGWAEPSVDRALGSLLDDSDPDVRAWAALACYARVERRPAASLTPETVCALARLTMDSDPSVRGWAAVARAASGEAAESLDAVLRAALEGTDQVLAEVAADVLGRAGRLVGGDFERILRIQRGRKPPGGAGESGATSRRGPRAAPEIARRATDPGDERRLRVALLLRPLRDLARREADADGWR